MEDGNANENTLPVSNAMVAVAGDAAPTSAASVVVVPNSSRATDLPSPPRAFSPVITNRQGGVGNAKPTAAMNAGPTDEVVHQSKRRRVTDHAVQQPRLGEADDDEDDNPDHGERAADADVFGRGMVDQESLLHLLAGRGRELSEWVVESFDNNAINEDVAEEAVGLSARFALQAGGMENGTTDLSLLLHRRYGMDMDQELPDCTEVVTSDWVKTRVLSLSGAAMRAATFAAVMAGASATVRAAATDANIGQFLLVGAAGSLMTSSVVRSAFPSTRALVAHLGGSWFGRPGSQQQPKADIIRIVRKLRNGEYMDHQKKHPNGPAYVLPITSILGRNPDDDDKEAVTVLFRLLCLPSKKETEELRHDLFTQLPREWQVAFVDAMGGGSLMYYRNVSDSRKWRAVRNEARAILKEDGFISEEDIDAIVRDMEAEEIVLSVPVQYRASLNRQACNANFNGRIVDQSMMAELIDDLDIDYDVKEDDSQESTMSVGIDMVADDMSSDSGLSSARSTAFGRPGKEYDEDDDKVVDDSDDSDY